MKKEQEIIKKENAEFVEIRRKRERYPKGTTFGMNEWKRTVSADELLKEGNQNK